MDKTIRLACAHIHCISDAPHITEWITAEIERRWHLVYGDEVTVRVVKASPLKRSTLASKELGMGSS